MHVESQVDIVHPHGLQGRIVHDRREGVLNWVSDDAQNLGLTGNQLSKSSTN
jgi:hypothetical protein